MGADLVRICDAAEELFSDAYALCSDMSSERKMIQQGATSLGNSMAGLQGGRNG